jgi:hypothetical protein
MTSFTPCNRLGDNITYSMSGWRSGTAAEVLGSSARFGPLSARRASKMRQRPEKAVGESPVVDYSPPACW